MNVLFVSSLFGAVGRKVFRVAVTALVCVIPCMAEAQTWLANPMTADWNTDANWVGGVAPNGTDATAIFDASTITSLNLSAPVTVNGLTFNPGAPAFSFSTLTPFSLIAGNLTIAGAGVVNNSSNAPIFGVYGSTFPLTVATYLTFQNAATAANADIQVAGGNLGFHGNASAGTSTIFINLAFPLGSTATFSDNSTAEDATITIAGFAQFLGNATAGNATIVTLDSGFVVGRFNISGLSTPGLTAGSIAGNGIYLLGSKNLEVGSNNADTVVTGLIVDREFSEGPVGGSLIKVGSGTLTLSGNNTYTGATTVQEGRLLVNGTQPTSNVVVVGGTLGGTGTVGTVTATGGTIAPGVSPGILNSGAVTLAPGVIFAVELNGTTAGTHYDQLNVTGNVTLNGADLGVTRDFLPLSGSTYTIIANDASDSVNGTFAGLPEGAGLAIDRRAAVHHQLRGWRWQ